MVALLALFTVAHVDSGFLALGGWPAHLLGFGSLGLLFRMALGPGQGFPIIVCLTGLGAVIEASQELFAANHAAQLEDVFANGLGATLGVVGGWAIDGAIKWIRKLRHN